MDKRSLTERDICTKFILPAVKRAGWDVVGVFMRNWSETDEAGVAVCSQTEDLRSAQRGTGRSAASKRDARSRLQRRHSGKNTAASQHPRAR